MKPLFKSALLVIAMSLSGALSAYSMTDDPSTVNLIPVKHGFGPNTGGSKSPDDGSCPLSVIYNQSSNLLEFENTELEAVTFTYHIYDVENNTVCYGTVCVSSASSYLLYLFSVPDETYTLLIEINGNLYMGYYGM